MYLKKQLTSRYDFPVPRQTLEAGGGGDATWTRNGQNTSSIAEEKENHCTGLPRLYALCGDVMELVTMTARPPVPPTTSHGIVTNNSFHPLSSSSNQRSQQFPSQLSGILMLILPVILATQCYGSRKDIRKVKVIKYLK